MRDEAPARLFNQFGRAVECAIHAHEERLHRLPEPRRDPIQAVPFANVRLSDTDMSEIIELAEREGIDPRHAGRRLGFPVLVVERELPNYLARHRVWIRSWDVP